MAKNKTKPAVSVGEVNIISAVVREFRDKYLSEHGDLKNYVDINCGYCEDFARDVIGALSNFAGIDHDELQDYEYANFSGKLGRGEADGVFYASMLKRHGYGFPAGFSLKDANVTDLGDYGTHVFIVYKNMCFDSECPDGVDSPFKLPFAMRRFDNIEHFRREERVRRREGKECAF